MERLKFTYWQDGEFYIGFLNDYPDYATQGMTKEELINNLKDLLKDIESGEIPHSQNQAVSARAAAHGNQRKPRQVDSKEVE